MQLLARALHKNSGCLGWHPRMLWLWVSRQASPALLAEAQKCGAQTRPAEPQNSSRAEPIRNVQHQDPAAPPLPRRSLCGPRAWPVRPAPRKRTREAKRAGRKNVRGAKRATSVFTLFRHPSSAATPRATSQVPPIAPASRRQVVQSQGERFPAQFLQIFKG